MRFIRPPAHPTPTPAESASRADAPLIKRSPLLFGYLLTLGALGAAVTGAMLYGLRSIIFSVFLAMFATVGLDPLIRWFQRRGMKRAWAIVTVILLIVAALVAIVWVVVPLIVEQIGFLGTVVPHEIARLRSEGWFDSANTTSNGVLGQTLTWIADQAKNPQTWASVGSGLLGLGISVLNASPPAFSSPS
ncbi:AI-2E family transporter [Leifsonia xyli]|uniref:AI-2E family transporter n=1 Tax=Leifsonia xyli TaxID=1575 RepID=UPI000A4F6B68|nr:AI-2E family transporter [Leifsonia xyli]